MLAIENVYNLNYNGNYNHSILMANKLAILSRVVEHSQSVAEYILRAYELEQATAQKTLSWMSAIDELHEPYVRKIHEQTNHKWHQPRLTDEQVASMFEHDLMERAEKELGELDTDIPAHALLQGGARIKKSAEIKL